MKIRELFDKDISRYIEGVIKASDDEHIFDEVDEYVVTGEIATKMSSFFNAYNDYQGANGVWISGFFGSGKSHLLKMLSYLLENRALDGAVHISEIFLEKPVIKDDALLKAEIKKAVKIPSKSILFNIDEKAVVISKAQVDAVLSVFLQVFNEMMGYHPKADYLAEFERQLDNEGKYIKFKEAYLKESGKTWESDRVRVHTRRNEIFARVLSSVDHISLGEAMKALDRLKDNFTVSIDNFTEIIKNYIDKQPKGFRLNFFVDEAGQYIAENVKLMTNLQTIAESLAVKCKGQAWIFVTSQQDMKSVIGDISAKQGNDFSKIIDRFKNKISLDSADVAEVIQKRLLAKKDSANLILKAIYEKEKNNFRTIFEFDENSRRYKLFANEDHFNYCYPFIPYQFELFQASIIGISKNNGFEGHYRSVGERSMLSVFQDVAKNISDQQTGVIAGFNLMYEGIKASLKTEIKNPIIQAERSDLTPATIMVLKALFLVKFVKEFKATLRNISILLLNHFDANVKEHEKTVKEALNELESQSYIQRNGELYEYLTDKEKSIEAEIKNTEIETADINKFMVDSIFRSTIKETKLLFEDNKEYYEFTRKFNDITSGKEEDLSINIITSDNDAHDSEMLLSGKSMIKGEMVVVLNEDSNFTQEVSQFLKTNKYIKINHSSTLSDEEFKLLAMKGSQNTEREQRLVQKVSDLITNAIIYINGSKLFIPASDPKSKIYKAFQELVKSAYPNVKMLKTVYRLTDLPRILENKEENLPMEENDSITEPENEIINFIISNKISAERTSIKSLIAYFSSNSYGWPQISIQCTIATLFLKGKIECKQDSNPLDKKLFSRNIQISSYFANTFIEIQEEFDEKSVKRLKDFHHELFHEINSGADAKETANIFKERAKIKIQELCDLLLQKNAYPFLDDLETAKKKLTEIVDKDYKYILKNQSEFEDEMLDVFEEKVDPIIGFMKSSQKEAYDQINSYVNSNKSNFNYLEDKLPAEKLLAIKESKAPYKNNFMKAANESSRRIIDQIEKAVISHRHEAGTQISSIINKIKQTDEYGKLDGTQKDSVISPFTRQIEKLEHESLIPVIKDIAQYSCNNLYQTQLALMASYLKPATVNKKGGHENKRRDPVFIRASSIKINFQKTHLSTEDDVNKYLEKVKEEFLKTIAEGNNIVI